MVRIKFTLWSLAFAVLSSWLLCAGGNARADEKPKPPDKKEPSDKETTKTLKELLTERRATLKDALDGRQKVSEVGAGEIVLNLRDILDLARDLNRAELDLTDKPSERVAACEEYLKRAKRIEDILSRQVAAGRVAEYILLQAKAARLEAEIVLLREKEKDK
jgi:hypothetical protein